LSDQTRQAIDDYLKATGKRPGEFLFTGHRGTNRCMTTRQYARLVSEWIGSVGLDPRLFGTHSLRRTKVRRVGFVNCLTQEANQEVKRKQSGSTAAISKWARSRDYDAVIWTALGIKFKETTGQTFSVDAAVRYLEGLDAAKWGNALYYIRRSPPEVQTPVRIATKVRWPAVD
jgi:hypothetical protein